MPKSGMDVETISTSTEDTGATLQAPRRAAGGGDVNDSSGRWRRGVSPFGVRLVGTALLLALVLGIAGAHVPFGADAYDEGLMVQGAALAMKGRLPAVDFYAPYPPGAFSALALVFRACGTRLIVERWFAALLAALVAVLGFWLVSGRTSGTGRAFRLDGGAAWLAGFAASLLLGSSWVTPVNGGALALVLATGLGLRAALPRGRPVAAGLCGALAGAAALWRLDFGAVALAAGIVVWSLLAGWAGEPPLSWPERAAGALALGLGALAAAGPPLAWILVHGGHRAAQSLIWWPLTGTAAARLPWMRHWTGFLVPLLSLAVLAGAAPGLRLNPRRGSLALWLLLVGLGFLSYALGRTDAVHLLPLQVVSLLLAGLAEGSRCAESPPNGSAKARKKRKRETVGEEGGLYTPSDRAACSLRSFAFSPRFALSRFQRRDFRPAPARGLLFAALVATAMITPLQRVVRSTALCRARHEALAGPRGTGVYLAPRHARDYARILTYLSRDVPPGARLFCGTRRHDLFLRDDNLAYFLSGRESGTYYWCLDAGITTTQPVQAEMTRELEANRVEVVLIRTAVTHHEPNAGGHSSGVHLLDDYLRRHYQLAVAWDDYQIYRRRQPSQTPSKGAKARNGSGEA